MKSYWAMGYARGIKCPEIVSHLSQKLLSVPHKSYAQQQSKISKYDSDMLSAGSYVHCSVNHRLSGFNYRFTSFLTHMLTVLSIRLFCLLASMDLTMGSCPHPSPSQTELTPTCQSVNTLSDNIIEGYSIYSALMITVLFYFKKFIFLKFLN